MEWFQRTRLKLAAGHFDWKGKSYRSTPMPMRKNAGLGMAKITNLVHEIAMSHQPDAVGAVGQCDVYPNSRNIIPER